MKKIKIKGSDIYLKLGTKIKNKKGNIVWEVEKIKPEYVLLRSDKAPRSMCISVNKFFSKWTIIE